MMGPVWKLATGVAAVVSLSLGIALTMTYLENRRLEDRIEVVTRNLNQARANENTLQAGLDSQNRAMELKAAADARVLTAVNAQLKKTQEDNRKLSLRIKNYMALPPRGVTLEQRVDDIDKRFMETLK